MKMTAKFHLPGLRYNYPLNMMLLSLKEKYPHYFQDNIEIASFFGEFPTSLWNGGRSVSYTHLTYDGVESA